MSVRLSGRDDADALLVILLAVIDTLHRKRIAEGLDRLIERHTMLLLVRGRLLVIPFEFRDIILRYEALFIVTQSRLFRAAIADGPSGVNTLSSYGTNPFGPHYVESGQFQHGGSLWDRPWVYLANSPLLHANRVDTPVLMMHNDRDPHPMAQSAEFFQAVRRNGGQAYLFNYLGEGHGLWGYAPRLDWNRRVNEFLDHYLKDSPPPRWLERLGTPNN